MKSSYQIIDGTHYNKNAATLICVILEKARTDNTRLILDYGDVVTGKSWDEVYGLTGLVSRSTGENKIPILLYNKRSIGGFAILTNYIVKITTSKNKRILYQHPTYSKSNNNSSG